VRRQLGDDDADIGELALDLIGIGFTVVSFVEIEEAAVRNYSPPLPSRYGRRAIDAGLRG